MVGDQDQVGIKLWSRELVGVDVDDPPRALQAEGIVSEPRDSHRVLHRSRPVPGTTGCGVEKCVRLWVRLWRALEQGRGVWTEVASAARCCRGVDGVLGVRWVARVDYPPPPTQKRYCRLPRMDGG